jgi:hypothetical protein
MIRESNKWEILADRTAVAPLLPNKLRGVPGVDD